MCVQLEFLKIPMSTCSSISVAARLFVILAYSRLECHLQHQFTSTLCHFIWSLSCKQLLKSWHRESNESRHPVIQHCCVLVNKNERIEMSTSYDLHLIPENVFLIIIYIIFYSPHLIEIEYTFGTFLHLLAEPVLAVGTYRQHLKTFLNNLSLSSALPCNH